MMRFCRLALMLCSALVVWNPVPASAAGPRPNIVLIMADDVGCETLGCYGRRTSIGWQPQA